MQARLSPWTATTSAGEDATVGSLDPHGVADRGFDALDLDPEADQAGDPPGPTGLGRRTERCP